MPYGPSAFWGTLEPKSKDEVLAEAGEVMKQKFWWYVEGLKDAIHVKKLTGEKLLDAYRNRQPQSWLMLQSYDPKEHDRQLNEWGHLEAKQRRMVRPPATPALDSPSAKLSPMPSPQEGFM